MSTRLATGGRLLNKSKPLSFTFNGKQMRGYEGDTLASALLANDQVLVGRSFKYHRPRGIVTSGPEEPNGLVGLGQEGHFEPNARVTTTELYEGLEAASQNHWPSLEFDVGALNKHLSCFLPAGVYYILLQPVSTADITVETWADHLITATQVSGEPVHGGDVTGMTAGVMDATFAPTTDLGTAADSTPIIQLDA
ncbi:hypothetical protein LCGC14_2022340 [marine sediment metagenome]|uniref:Uncharacterized protein n=1 Tax=marine sediment metagenome TaxID=412755 RepID=A0A0F9FJK5_9ZZZZ